MLKTIFIFRIWIPIQGGQIELYHAFISDDKAKSLMEKDLAHSKTATEGGDMSSNNLLGQFRNYKKEKKSNLKRTSKIIEEVSDESDETTTSNDEKLDSKLDLKLDLKLDSKLEIEIQETNDDDGRIVSLRTKTDSLKNRDRLVSKSIVASNSINTTNSHLSLGAQLFTLLKADISIKS